MSRRLTALNTLLRLIARPRLSHVRDPQEARRDFARTARLVFRAPPYSLWLPGAVRGEAEGAPEIPGLWISCGPVRQRHVILYLHGGGYTTGSPDTHRGMLARLSKLSGLRVFAPDYRLAPEHPAPAALEDAQAAWDGLVALGYEPERIVLAGDSAGGGLAFALLARLCAAGTPPALAIGLAPWVDLAGGGASLAENAGRDALLPAARFEDLVRLYAGTLPRNDVRLSPLYADFPDPPPVLLQVSESEILRDDTLRLEARLRDFGAEVTLQTWPDAPHVFQIFDGWVPEARDALEGAAAEIRRRLAEIAPADQG
ncbi:alpha/beta hydrolase [Acidimangrovimonas pyrenivorans]|uniref:Alpha/beta hydrolase n=1 Tax=Acidimangrovimonas pyrenivorans TaxID=2030798 RepID=A0ABV7ALR2_9RHOB